MKIHKKEKEKEKEEEEEDRIQKDILKLYEAFHQTSSMPTQKSSKVTLTSPSASNYNS